MSEIAVAEPSTRLQKFLDRAGLRGFPWKTAIILYTISWGWLFIVRDSYWADDWDILRLPRLSDFDYESAGHAPWRKIVHPLHNLFGPGFLHVLIFLIFFFISIAAFGISRKFLFFTLWDRRIFVLAFLLLPFNPIRVMFMTLHYTTGMLMFFLAWYLTLYFKSFGFWIISLILFFLSFQMHSLLFFFSVPFIHLNYLSRSKNLPYRLGFGRQFALILAPVTYFVLRQTLWPETYLYHAFGIREIIDLIPFLVFASCVLGLQLIIRFVLKPNSKIGKANLIFLVGAACSFIAFLPYLLARFYITGMSLPAQFMTDFIGRSEYRSRHLALQPLGFAIGTIGLLSLISSTLTWLKNFLVTLVICVSLVFNLQFGFEYWIDFSKQNAVVEALQDFKDQRVSDEYQVFDLVPLLNAQAASNRFLWQKLIGVAYGEDYALDAKIESQNKCVPFDRSNYLMVNGPKTHALGIRNWLKSGDFGFDVKIGVMNGRCLPEMARVSVKTVSWPILFFFRGSDITNLPYSSMPQFYS